MKPTTITLHFFLVASLLSVSCAEGPEKVTVKLAEGRECVPAGEFGYNPISPMGVYMADPSAKVMDGKLYVACSLDVPAGKGEWLTLECDVHDVKEGPQALWFTFSGDRGGWQRPVELFELDWLRFE